MTYSPRTPQANEAIELLAQNQIADKRRGAVLQTVGPSRSPAAEKLLRAALEGSPHAEVQAQACYNLATLLMTQQQRCGVRPQTCSERGRQQSGG